MTTKDFNEIIEARHKAIDATLKAKAAEYAIDGDRLYNFKVAAAADLTTPEKALWGMFMKHYVSVRDLVYGNLPCNEAIINEQIGDAINYLILLEAILKRQR